MFYLAMHTECGEMFLLNATRDSSDKFPEVSMCEGLYTGHILERDVCINYIGQPSS